MSLCDVTCVSRSTNTFIFICEETSSVRSPKHGQQKVRRVRQKLELFYVLYVCQTAEYEVFVSSFCVNKMLEDMKSRRHSLLKFALGFR